MLDRYDYKPRVLTPDRQEEITALAEDRKTDAAHDVEDHRAVYEALIDLLAIAPITYPPR